MEPEYTLLCGHKLLLAQNN